MKISDRTKLCREKLGLSQGKVAELLGISQPSYQRLEKGDVKNPKQLEKLAQIYQTTPQWIKFGVGTPPSYLNGMMMAEGQVPLFENWNIVKDWKNENFNIEKIFNSRSLTANSAVGQPLRGAGISFVPVPNKTKPQLYALKIDSTSSLTTGRRPFLKDDIIVIDPTLTCMNNDYVIAILDEKSDDNDESEPMLAQYAYHGGNHYLNPLNTQLPSIPVKLNEIYGVVTTVMHFLTTNR